MGFRTIAGILLTGMIALSCSKPAQENSSTADSTANPPEVRQSELPEAILTPEETNKINTELFVFIRESLLSSSNVAYQEEFVVNGNEFKYTLLRHNDDNAGLTSDGPSDSTYSEVRYYFTPEIDTFYVTGTYIAYVKSKPEESPRRFDVSLLGKTIQRGGGYVEYGEPHSQVSEYEIGDTMDFSIGDLVEVDLRNPLYFKSDRMYVLAKIRDLSDDDLKSLSKAELSILRNDIFARHGHIFKTPQMVNHYKEVGWYHPLINDASSLLNNFEKRNVEFIKKREG